jgi:hypothetical protein
VGESAPSGGIELKHVGQARRTSPFLGSYIDFQHIQQPTAVPWAARQSNQQYFSPLPWLHQDFTFSVAVIKTPRIGNSIAAIERASRAVIMASSGWFWF